MDAIEKLATAEPLNAKTLTLGTVANEYPGKKERWETMKAEGKAQPSVRPALKFRRKRASFC